MIIAFDVENLDTLDGKTEEELAQGYVELGMSPEDALSYLRAVLRMLRGEVDWGGS